MFLIFWGAGRFLSFSNFSCFRPEPETYPVASQRGVNTGMEWLSDTCCQLDIDPFAWHSVACPIVFAEGAVARISSRQMPTKLIWHRQQDVSTMSTVGGMFSSCASSWICLTSDSIIVVSQDSKFHTLSEMLKSQQAIVSWASNTHLHL